MTLQDDPCIEQAAGMLPQQDREAAFRRDLEHLLNSHSRENGSDTPDFILADFLANCLRAWDMGVTRRTQWYAPAGKSETDPSPR